MRHTPALLAALAIALLLTTTLTPLAGASDALLDAKRDAAAKLLKDGKTADAQKLYEEIIAADATTWSDHYALAKIYDKAGEADKAVERYRQTVKELKNRARNSTERSALAESEKRLKVLDELSDKLDQAIADFSKLLDGIEREAAAQNLASIRRRVEMLRKSLGRSVPQTHRVTVNASADWQDTSIEVSSGALVQIESRGSWSMNRNDPNASVGPRGNDALPPFGGHRVGTLLVRIGSGAPVAVGDATSFQADRDGAISFAANDSNRSDNAGELEVAVRVSY